MTKSETTEYSLTTVSQIMSLYSSMLHGQIFRSEELPIPEKVAAVLFAADVLGKMHSQVIMALCAKENVSPAWMVNNEKVEEQAKMFCKKVMEGPQ